MKKLFCILFAVLMIATMISCGGAYPDEFPKTPVTQDMLSESAISKEPKKYTLIFVSRDDGENTPEIPESLTDRVTIQYGNEKDFALDFGGKTKIENMSAEPERTLTIDGKTYKYTLKSSVANKWSQGQEGLVQEYAYFDNYTCSMPQSEVTFNATTGKISSFAVYGLNKSQQGAVSEEEISQKSKELLSELYGIKSLESYTELVYYNPLDCEYIVLYRHDFGKYLGDDWVNFYFTPKGELTCIDAERLGLLAEYDFTEAQLDAAKEAMFSAIYSNSADWSDYTVYLTIDGLTGTCYMQTFIYTYNGKEVNWEILLALD